MTGRRQARRNGAAQPQVDLIRRLLEAEAERHEPDRAAIYRRVLDSTADQRGRRPAGSPGSRGGQRRAPRQHRPLRVGLGSPRVVAGATAAVVVGVAVATAVVTVDEASLSPTNVSPATASRTPADGGPAGIGDEPSGLSANPSAGYDGTRPEDNPPVDPPTTSPTAGTGQSTGTASPNGPAQPPGGTAGGVRPPAVLAVSEAGPWEAGTSVALPGPDTVDWVLFGGQGVSVRSATASPALEVTGPNRPTNVLELTKRFDWTSGTPQAQGSHVSRLLVGSQDSVVLTVPGDPSRVRHLNLYLGTLSGTVKIEISAGGASSTLTRTLPTASISRLHDGLVTVDFKPTDPSTELTVVIQGESTFYQPTTALAAAVLR